jgi:hypothetical protein
LSLFDAPKLDRLLGSTPEQVELSVSVDGAQASVVQIASSDPLIRVYMLGSDPSHSED